MVKERFNGQMEQIMKENGKIIEHKDKENLLIQTVIPIKVNGTMIERMVSEYILI